MLKRVYAHELAPRDIELLVKCDLKHTEDARIPIKEIVKELWAGTMDLWRCEYGVVLAQATGKRYTILRLVGDGLGLRLAAVAECLQHRAKELGCTALDSIVYDNRLINAMKRIGAKPEATVMVLEFD